VPAYTAISQALATEINAALTSNLSPAQALAKAAAAGNQAIASGSGSWRGPVLTRSNGSVRGYGRGWVRPRSSIAPATARARWHPPGRRARHWGTAYALVLPVLALTVILFPLVVTSSEKLMMVSQGLTIFEGRSARSPTTCSWPAR